jgi:phosphate transport system substrate-binding protein
MIRLALALCFFVLTGLLVGCGGNDDTEAESATPRLRLSGAGATEPRALYDDWRFNWGEANDVTLNYAAMGSEAGVLQLKAGTVDFAASDRPLATPELAEAGLVQWPMLLGAVVPIVNLPRVDPGEVRLTGEVLAEIYLGEITRWDDPALVALNPEVALPDAPITVLHRSDPSGATLTFTRYLSGVSEAWAAGLGESRDPEWPTGRGVAQHSGMVSEVGRTMNAIGYVQRELAEPGSLPFVRLQNPAGDFVAPTAETLQAAAAAANWAETPGLNPALLLQPGQSSWPITTATFFLVAKEPETLEKLQTLLRWADWAFAEGDERARENHFVPLPDSVVEAVKATWAREFTHQGAPVWPIRGGTVAAAE